jgi:hypothetical protein
MKTYILKTVEDAVAVATTLTRSWFRGHGRIVEELTPRVFRSELTDEMVQSFRPGLELDIIEAFKRDAPTLSQDPIPAGDDHLAWLCLMQHYRTPTRLLDWTENALIALYFVVTEDADADGELWAMFPLPLNRESGVGWGTPIPNTNPVLRFLLAEPYWAGTRESLAEEMGLDKPANRPIAFLPTRDFKRMTAQASVFTIHPPPEQGDTIPDILHDPKHLVRYVIPGNAKFRLRQGLDALGITEVGLFPDLEGLSRKVIWDNRVIAYTPPDPPVASGTWSDE